LEDRFAENLTEAEAVLKRKLLYIIVVFIILVLFFVPSSYARGWLYQNPYLTSYTLTGVKFVSSDKGWVIGQVGTILYTEDGGNTWELQESGITLRLINLFFINDKTGWIVGNRGTILYTEDGGKKWVSQESGSNNYELLKVFFTNSKEGWIIGCDADKNISIILYTKDSGKTWEKQSHGFRQLNGIFFMDSNIGWILADNKVFKTIDKGKTWTSVGLSVEDPTTQSKPLSPFLPPPPPQSCVTMAGGDIYFANNNEGWVLISTTLGTQIFHTDDGGKTWKFQFSGGMRTYNPPKPRTVPGGMQVPGLGSFTGQALFMNAFFFADNKRGCAIGDTIFCTEDGGLTWEERLGIKLGKKIEPINGFYVKLFAGNLVNNTGWVVGRDGLIMKTEDGGKSWTVKVIRRVPFFHFIDGKTGFAYKDGFIIKTDDGGETWRAQVEIKNFRLQRFFVFSQLEELAIGYIINQDTKNKNVKTICILHTYDGGKTWVTKVNDSVIQSPETLRGFYFVDFNNGWIVGDKGVIFHTKDGGKTWQPQKSGTGLLLKNVYFVDKKKGWAIGDSGVYGYTEEDDPQPQGIILYTENGGENWRVQWHKKGVWLSGIFFLNSQKGWIGGSGFLLYTENGGKNWLKKEIPDIRGEFSSPFFIDDRHGWFSVEEEAEYEELDVSVWSLIFTEDGGKTWKKLKPGLHKYPWRPFDKKQYNK
jgi:photosystem II stability/assembly factor-like uncharacterized protein